MKDPDGQYTLQGVSYPALKTRLLAERFRLHKNANPTKLETKIGETHDL